MDYKRPVKYSARMAFIVESYTLAGLSTNADFARVLRSHMGMQIRADDVARWRRENWRFDDACSTATDHMLAKCMSVIMAKIDGGDDANARWVMERRSPAFMPKMQQKLEGIGTLDDILSRRGKMTDQEMRERGLVDDDDA